MTLPRLEYEYIQNKSVKEKSDEYIRNKFDKKKTRFLGSFIKEIYIKTPKGR